VGGSGSHISGFFGIGGKNSGQQNQAVGNLNSLFNFGLNTSKSQTNAGSANQDAASSYFAKLASGNRPAMLQAIAPETTAINQTGDAQRRQQVASGTARGGGVAGANQTADTDRMTQINTALFGVHPAAAKEQADIGGKQLAEGLGFAGVGGTATANAGNIATSARSQHGSEVQQTIKDIFGWG